MTTDKSNFEQHLEKLKNEYKAQLPVKLEAIVTDWNRLNHQWNPELMVTLHRNVHSLIGTSGTFGFTDISKTARELETQLKPLIDLHDNANAIINEQQESVNAVIAKLTHLISPAENTADNNTVTIENEENSFAALNASLTAKTTTLTIKEVLIYLLDDEVAAPTALVRNFLSYGFKSKHFRTMSDLLVAIQNKPPHLVILDLVMPDITIAKVFELAKSIVKMDIKVFMLSGRDDFDARLCAVRAGAHAYIAKPADVPSLVAQIRHVLNLSILKPPHILIVDDQESVAQFYATVLTQTGMKTTVEIDPSHVLNVMKANTPDLLLLDLNMPNVSGTELAAIIRQQEKHQSIPIIFLSAEANPDKKTSLLEVGSDDLLSKGMQPEELVRQVKSRVERARTLTAMMYHDSLTGLLNHAQIQIAAERVFQHSKRTHAHFCVAMVDIDKFKSVNDTYGHLTGDRVLKALSQLLEQRLRSTDYIGRFGGEEFMLVLPDVSINDAGKLVNELRRAFSAIKFKEDDVEFTVSFSAGLAENSGMDNFIEQIKMADEALYKAKNRGRNLVCASLSGDTNQ
jgi:diguanylate cyclase (GGDEF)-like protein